MQVLLDGAVAEVDADDVGASPQDALELLRIVDRGSECGDDLRTADHTCLSSPSMESLLAYLDSSPSPWHAVGSSCRHLDAAGFVELDERDPWADLPAAGYVVRGGALIAWRRPSTARPRSIRIIGAHTDSPCLRVKPNPDTSRAGWRQLGVEVYGGVLLNSWLDRDLGLAGRVLTTDGDSTLVHVDAAIARVPQLAIHLDREVNEHGLVLDRQAHLTPVWATELSRRLREVVGRCRLARRHPGVVGAVPVRRAAGARAGRRSINAGERASRQPRVVLGGDDCPRGCRASADLAVIALFDHEEVGSASTTGASGPFLSTILERLHGDGSRDDFHRLLAASSCISADNAHAVHPNYPERHDPDHAPIVNHGPAIKINMNQRYATSADTAQLFASACEQAGVPVQTFVSRNNMPCGSTIGPLTATRLGIATVDVGVPQLSMHSARELCGVRDPQWLADALAAYFAG